MVNGRLNPVPAAFAIKPPFTMRMLEPPRVRAILPQNFNSLLVFAAANVSGVVNHRGGGEAPE
jgi:hypothetical protein